MAEQIDRWFEISRTCLFVDVTIFDNFCHERWRFLENGAQMFMLGLFGIFAKIIFISLKDAMVYSLAVKKGLLFEIGFNSSWHASCKEVAFDPFEKFLMLELAG